MIPTIDQMVWRLETIRWYSLSSWFLFLSYKEQGTGFTYFTGTDIFNVSLGHLTAEKDIHRPESAISTKKEEVEYKNHSREGGQCLYRRQYQGYTEPSPLTPYLRRPSLDRVDLASFFLSHPSRPLFFLFGRISALIACL